eukprot:TRINITY_DN3054_c0_g1_i2.p1 TRINITY_DN3054_c0_g1~~TRINITY_DN3054_c0_g1_i2.p1  ORF type:complete len:164 (+),score=37.08 TRINITY_DN3054_c0_g1_i2:368-859(+)
MGVEDFQPRVLNQFLQLWYRYVVDILTDAQVYSEHAGKSAIDTDDIKIAIQSKVNLSFSQPPPREALLELASRVNSMPLPESIGGPGLPLPPEADMLIFPNYQLAIQSKSSNQAPQDVETEDAEGSKGDIGNSQPPQEQKSDHEASAQRVSFSISAKRPKLEP